MILVDHVIKAWSNRSIETEIKWFFAFQTTPAVLIKSILALITADLSTITHMRSFLKLISINNL